MIMAASGIYAIQNSLNKRMYIGSSINIQKRFEQHKRALKRGDHKNPILQNSWNKYGEERFKFIILEKTDPKNLIKLEQNYIDINKNLYNLQSFVERSQLGRCFSETARKNISLAHKGLKQTEEQKRKKSMTMKKHWANPEYRKAQTGIHDGYIVSKETKQKISEAQKGKTIPLEQRKKISRTLKGRRLSPEHKKKVSEGMKRALQNPEVRKKYKHRLFSEQTLKKMSEIQKKRYSDPKNRQITSIAIKKWWDKRRGII